VVVVVVVVLLLLVVVLLLLLLLLLRRWRWWFVAVEERNGNGGGAARERAGPPPAWRCARLRRHAASEPGSGGMLPWSPGAACARWHAGPRTRVALGPGAAAGRRLPLLAGGEGVLLAPDRSPEPFRMSGGGVRARSLRSYHY